jgi:hypothetical protein
MSLIDLETGKQMIERYKNARTTLLSNQYSPDILTFSETFPRADFDALLKQTGCENIRLYFGMDATQNIRAVFVGVDANGTDILEPGSEVIAENGSRCPEVCPEPSPINP